MVRFVRSPMDELRHRRDLRKKYFEDPAYRKWSDVVPGGTNGIGYMSWSDYQLFDYLITGQTIVQSNLTTIQNHLRNGYKLPINWYNFYAYFNERLNDYENRYIEELTNLLISDDNGHRSNIKGLLDKYQDSLLPTYDMV